MNPLMNMASARAKARWRASGLRRALGWLATLALVAAGWVSAEEASPRKVTLQLKWSHQFQFAGYYAAQAKGFYQAEGLDVTLREASPTRLPIPEVESGGAEFGVSDMEVFQAYLEGRPLVALGVVFQHSPNVLLVLRSSGIHRLSQLVGRTIMCQGLYGLVEARAMLESEGLRADGLRPVPHSWNLDDLAKGRVDVLSAYSTDEPYQLKQRGVDFVQLRPSDYGVDFYGDLLFTTKAFATDHPAQAVAFRRASFQGWDYAMEHPEEMIDHILALPGVAARGVTREQLRFEAERMRELVLPGLVDIGHMNPGRFRRMADLSLKQGLLKTPRDPEGFIFEPPQPSTQSWLRVLLVAMPVLSALGLLVVLWIIQLRHTVNVRTRELQDEIRQRKQGEEAHRKSASQLRTLIDTIPDLVWLKDPGGVYLECNSRFERFFGALEKDIMGKTDHDFVDRALADQFRANDLKAMAAGKPCVNEEEIRFADDGHREDLETIKTPVFDAQGKVLGVLGIGRNITERKRAEKALSESEERLRVIFEASEAGIILVSPEGEIEFANRRMGEMFGTSPQALIGTPYPDHLHPSEQRTGDERMRALIQGEIHSVSLERHYLRADGSSFWGHLSGRRLEHADGSLRALVGVITDITEWRRAEEEKLLLQIQLQQAQKMDSLGSLAGGVAHDMNNVLGAILGLASASIETQPAGSPAQVAFGTIIKAAERGGKMVKSLLNFARQSPVEDRAVDMNVILLEEARLLEHTTLSRVRLVLDLAPDLRPIRGDASALTHAFMNLCVNAVDALPEDGTLTLRTRNVDRDWIEVVVEDTGVGMSKEILDKALDPFFTTKDVGKGTGLGLSIVYSTVKAHHGQLALHSEPGQGTCVSMRFPACDRDTRGHEPLNEERTIAPLGSLHVLLVDDDELIQSAMGAVLEALGHRVTLAPSGEEALARLEEGLRPDVVILDMNMPGLGGARTLPRLRDLCPEVPVLLATGRADQAATDLAKAHPRVMLMSKPFGMKELRAHLDPIAGSRPHP